MTSPAIFASAFHPHVGGVEELTRQLAGELLRRGSSPVVVTNRYPKDLPAHETHRGINIWRAPFRVPEPTARQFLGWAVHGRRTELSIAAMLRNRGTDVVHVQCVSSNGRYALAVAERLGLPLVVTMQGELTMDATGVYQRSSQLRRTWRRLLDRADVITGCSQFVLDEAAVHYGRPLGDRATVVYNGIRLAEFDDAAPEVRAKPYVLGIGRMVSQKGFDVLIAAFARLAENGTELELVLAGDGPEVTSLRQLATALGLGDRVHFLGSVDHGRAVQLYKGASAFVLPSRHEPQGIVVLEGMAATVPVIAAAVGGVPEIVDDGVNGLLFPAGDSDELAARLHEVLAAPDLSRRIAEAGRKTAEGFDWARITQQYGEVYRRALSRRHS